MNKEGFMTNKPRSFSNLIQITQEQIINIIDHTDSYQANAEEN